MARNPQMTANIGGGGCPSSYDTLVPDLPFDFLQPVMRKQITQVGYGGPFVIRGNPIGALLDTIRNFCSPIPMQASSDGTVYSDLSGNGLGSYGDYTSTQLPLEGIGAGGFGVPGFQTPLQCSSGYMPGYDAVGNQACVPVTAATTPSTTPGAMTATGGCDDPNFLNQVGMQAATAYAMKDCNTLCALLGTARGCATTASLPGLPLKWNALWAVINGYLLAMGIRNCSTQCTSPAATTPAAGATTNPPPPATGTTGGTTGGTPSGSTGGMPKTSPPPSPMNPLSYIPAANPGRGTVTVQSAMRMPAMPEMPSPFSLTEGNLGMIPSGEPMGGMFDPGMLYSTQRVVRTGNDAARQRLGTVARRFSSR